MNAQRLVRMSCVLAVLAAVGLARAANGPLTEEEFGYAANTPIAGDNLGIGWAGPWSGGNEVMQPGLTYANGGQQLIVNGNRLQLMDIGDGSWRSINTAAYPSTDLWVSFLVRRDQAGDKDMGALWLYGGSESLIIGQFPNTDNWCIGTSAVWPRHPPTSSRGARIFSSPTLLLGAGRICTSIRFRGASGAPAATYNGVMASFSEVELLASSGPSLPYSFDELRIGTT